MNPVLEVTGLEVAFATPGGTVQAVRGLDCRVLRGQTLAVVGESGCGKSTAMQAVMGLIPSPPGRITGGQARLNGRSLLDLSPRQLDRIRGREMTMIFQDPMSALNPTLTIGQQVAEPLRMHRGLGHSAAWRQAVALLEQTGIAAAERRARQYPHVFSGGMLQRTMIAMALAAQPSLLIADEPTSALDVTIQAQILDLLASLQRQRGMAIVLITHDLGVVARLAHRVAVMYAGLVVESAPVEALFAHPGHPYTVGLRQALPDPDPGEKRPLQPIPGAPPNLSDPPAGCGYAPRCPHAMRLCRDRPPPLFELGPDHQARCWLHHPQAPRRSGLQNRDGGS
ncbi:MAG: ABC transporter ATP-binding protein [Magnetococcales bacterium]|nr:ABC transporter ATP-binding protein [Magnetococcales bacterium]